MRKKIWVVIPYYRDSAALSRCVDKLNQSTVKDFEIFIRDNTNDNILYTAAVNEGIRAGMADAEVGYFMILNQDCYLESTALEILVSHLIKFNNCGIACPLQLQGDNDVTGVGSLATSSAGVTVCSLLYLPGWMNVCRRLSRLYSLVSVVTSHAFC